MSRHDKNSAEIDKIIATNLRLLRLEQRISRDELAAKIKVSYQQLDKYEKGTNRISAGRLAMAAKALKVPIESFYKMLVEPNEIPLKNEFLYLKMVKSFVEIANREQQRALYELVKTMAPKKVGRV